MVVAIVGPSFILFCCCFYWTIVWLFPKSHGRWARTSMSNAGVNVVGKPKIRGQLRLLSHGVGDSTMLSVL